MCHIFNLYVLILDVQVFKKLYDAERLDRHSQSEIGNEKKFAFLVKDLRESGPEQPTWQNYSKLSQNEYHCHIEKSWVACWKHEDQTIEIEVYYVGSREKAPY